MAKTKTGQDQIALDNLTRQHFESFYPTQLIAKIHRGRMVQISEGYFPGYVLIKFSRLSDQWRIINNTRGVQKLLSFRQDGLPSSIPDREVEELQVKEKQREFDKSLRVGDRVRMKSSSLSQPLGRVTATRGERIEFLMRLLGRDVKCIAQEAALYLVGRSR